MKLKLNNDDLTDDFFNNVHIIGIVSTLKGYKFCWSLNHYLSIDFRLHPDVEVQLEKHRLFYYFNIYSFSDPDSNVQHMLYENETKGEYLVPEFKHLDYIWLIRFEDDIEISERDLLLDRLRQLDIIQLATFIQLDNIKSKENLII
jgi:hypothetical protein